MLSSLRVTLWGLLLLEGALVLSWRGRCCDFICIISRCVTAHGRRGPASS
jgi:hypothetical protein